VSRLLTIPGVGGGVTDDPYFSGARRLYISTKTASVHVSNILAKLGMTSRTEVATWAVRTGLVPPR
jgi:hypothetical protein